MSANGEILIGLVIAVGLVGVLVPVLPGVLLIAVAIGFWAVRTGTEIGWIVFGVAAALLVGAGVVKYTWPGRRMRYAGIPGRSLLVGALLAIVGFFVIPVLGLPIGFVVGIYLAELLRLRRNRLAWQSTVHAVKATGLALLIEFTGALLASGVWVIGAVLS
ncbi:DUF456 domain-containing protein [Skermania piniformis]|uniref:DUF456 domain-containing protein n=1 Tax=Skermania pinensis TaxID=39122 RepID=A0ABX8S8P2_9ACTN|nr:DUF456 domain-containing protein [Skermania piniformis]QXQ14238.1 DUF456 domain-containing protein [Skermania piniformis]